MSGQPEVKGKRSGDYLFESSEGRKRADLYNPERKDPKSVLSGTLSKSGQADVAVVEFLRGESKNLGLADAQELLANLAKTPNHSIKRLVVVKDGQIILDEPVRIILAPERLGNLLDQFSKLDHALGELAEGGTHAIDGVRGIGKYGQRLADALEKADVYNASAWEKLLKKCEGLKAAADAGEIAKRFAAGEAEAVIEEARQTFDELIARSWDGLTQLRGYAGVEQIGDAAAKLQAATLAHVRLIRAVDLTTRNLWALIRTPLVAATNSETEANGP